MSKSYEIGHGIQHQYSKEREREREARAYNPQNNLNNKSEINVLVENR